MKATEMFIEQILIGSIAVAILTLPLYPEIAISLSTAGGNDGRKLVAGVAISSVLLGLVYLIGVVFDRLADTILTTWERHLRLRFALKSKNWPPAGEDPFPEGRYRVQILIRGGEAANWIEYLRTRVRLARSLAIFLPGLVIALQTAVLRSGCEGKSDCGGTLTVSWLGVVVLAIYALMPSIQWALRRNTLFSKSYVSIWHPPRTDAPAAKMCHYSRPRGLPHKDGASWGWTIGDICLGTPFILFMGLTVMSANIVLDSGMVWLLGITVSGFSLTVLSAWAWARIVGTYMRYVKQIGCALKEQNGRQNSKPA